MINRQTSPSTPKFYALDFFCGAGGTTNGLISAGGHVIAGIDKEGECRSTFEGNNINPDGSHAEYWQMDIYRKEDDYPDGQQEEIISAFEAKVRPKLDDGRNIPLLLSICAPCQPFTNMTRIKMTEERSTSRTRDRDLLLQCLEYVDRFSPDYILCENVAGIQKAKYGDVWKRFMTSLSERGFICGSAVVDTANFGVPQHRKRSIMIAARRTDVDPEWITEDDDGSERLVVPMKDGSGRLVTVGETLNGLPPLKAGERDNHDRNHRCAGLSDLNKERLSAVKPGGSNLAFDGSHLALDCHKKLRQGKTTGFTDVYTRMSPDRPAPTITTKCFSVSNGRFGHPDTEQVRAISVREAALLQSFPKDYAFMADSLQQQARMVGNAVPPKLADFFAKHLVETIVQKGRQLKAA